jgi:hypothetical protein
LLRPRFRVRASADDGAVDVVLGVLVQGLAVVSLVPLPLYLLGVGTFPR